jgi:hypothetical protein
VISDLAKFDTDSLPDVKILPGPSVEFDEIVYDVPVTKTIEVANVGHVSILVAPRLAPIGRTDPELCSLSHRGLSFSSPDQGPSFLLGSVSPRRRVSRFLENERASL